MQNKHVCLHLSLLSDLLLGEEVIPQGLWHQLLLFQGILNFGLAENYLHPSNLPQVAIGYCIITIGCSK